MAAFDPVPGFGCIQLSAMVLVVYSVMAAPATVVSVEEYTELINVLAFPGVKPRSEIERRLPMQNVGCTEEGGRRYVVLGANPGDAAVVVHSTDRLREVMVSVWC